MCDIQIILNIHFIYFFPVCVLLVSRHPFIKVVNEKEIKNCFFYVYLLSLTTKSEL